MTSEVHEPEDNAGRSTTTLIISAFIATSILALMAIGLSIYILLDNRATEQSRQCVRNIDLYVAEIRDDINTQGWDALVARTEGSPNVDVQQIAREMRTKIKSLRSTRELRNDAIKICTADPNFKPR